MASRFVSPARMMAAKGLGGYGQTLRLGGYGRSFHTTPRAMADATPLPVRKPIGAFRGGLFGFLLGSTLAGAGVYYYILEEYRVSNELLTGDIYSLQASVQRVHTYVQTLEEEMAQLKKK